MPHSRVALATASLLLALGSTPAVAQAPGPRAISLATGLGITFPFDTRLYENDGFSWHASARFPAVEHINFEVNFDRSAQARSEVRRNVNLYGPNGIHGHVDEVRVDGRIAVNTVSVGAMLEGKNGRTTITAGGGPAFVILQHRHSEVRTGCTATPPRTCEDFVTKYWDGAWSLHAAIDVGVQLTSRVSSFARASLRSGEGGLIAGLRVSATKPR